MAAVTCIANVSRGAHRPVGAAVVWGGDPIGPIVRRGVAVGALVGALAGCGNIDGFGGAPPPLATIAIQATGDFATVQQAAGAPEPTLRVALVWAAQYLTEPLCILPPDNEAVAAVVRAGCRDPFGFVPDRVGANAPLGPDGSATLELFDLPAADVMVGDVTARIAYASLVIYDDRDGNGTLTLHQPGRLPSPEDDDMEGSDPSMLDLVYAASFVTMTEPDTRLAFREGAFNRSAAFYPRNGCGDPLPSFSIVSAGGFTAAAAIAAQLRGELPLEDPATCRERSTEEPVALAYRPPSQLAEVACSPRRTDSSVRYREPPMGTIVGGSGFACAKIPDFGSGRTAGMFQLVLPGRATNPCREIRHYVLRGCRNDPACALPEWDLTATPPPWWPCPVQAAQ